MYANEGWLKTGKESCRLLVTLNRHLPYKVERNCNESLTLGAKTNFNCNGTSNEGYYMIADFQ